MIDEKENHFTGNLPEIESGIDRKKAISDEISFKYPFFRNDRDIAEEA